MLTTTERYKVLKFLRICSVVGPLPIQVDLAKWELKKASSRKQWIALASYSLFVLHSLYQNCGLVHAHFFVPNVQLHQLIIHASVAISSATLIAFWYFVAYIWDPTLFAAFFQTTLLENIGGTFDGNDHSKKHWAKRLRGHSRQDLIAISLPYLIMLAVQVISISYVYDPSMRILLFSALPSHLQNWVTFGLCLVEEIRFLLMFLVYGVPVEQLQVISIDLVSHQLQLLKRSMEKRSGSSVYTELRRHQLYISMLNNLNSYMIFTWKLVSISLCIMTGYAALAHFQEHPVFGIMYYVILFDCAVGYAVVYEKASMIPELFEQAAAGAILCKRGRHTSVLRRQIMSLPSTGINVGSFHKMEKASTLIFMDYVVTNIVNMLVAYR